MWIWKLQPKWVNHFYSSNKTWTCYCEHFPICITQFLMFQFLPTFSWPQTLVPPVHLLLLLFCFILFYFPNRYLNTYAYLVQFSWWHRKVKSMYKKYTRVPQQSYLILLLFFCVIMRSWHLTEMQYEMFTDLKSSGAEIRVAAETRSRRN